MESLFETILGATITLPIMLAVLGASLALGLIISLVYMLTHKNEGFVPSFAVTIVMLPIIIAVIIILIGDNIARAFSLAGAFTIIRFRSAPADPKDITYIFFTLAVGLALGLGYIGYAVVFTIILCVVTTILGLTKYGVPRREHMTIKITIPENLNYQGLFDDIFNEYAAAWRLKRVKTADFGALLETVYFIELNKDCNQKEMLDKIRARNGNLNIQLTFREYEDKLYQQ